MDSAPNRRPPQPEGQPIHDDGGVTTIGWCWWSGQTLLATDDRWGVQSEHEGSVMLAIARAVRAVRARTGCSCRAEAMDATRLLDIRDELLAIDAETRRIADQPERSCRFAELVTRHRELAQEFTAMGLRARPVSALDVRGPRGVA